MGWHDLPETCAGDIHQRTTVKVRHDKNKLWAKVQRSRENNSVKNEEGSGTDDDDDEEDTEEEEKYVEVRGYEDELRPLDHNRSSNLLQHVCFQSTASFL